jgi:hypothetical protein
MRLLAMLYIAAGAASAATTYTATSLQVAGSPYQIPNVWGLNNRGRCWSTFAPTETVWA